MGETRTISLPADSEGFLSRKCPSCSKLFKVKLGEGSDKPLTHCPYCNMTGEDWFTEDQRIYVQAAGKNFAQEVFDQQFGEIARKFNQGTPGGGFITAKLTHKPSTTEPLPSVPIEDESPMPVVAFVCCGEKVKHDNSMQELHCIICGCQVSF